MSITVPSSLNVICGTLGKIETKSILSDKYLSSKIKEAGNQALRELLASPDYLNFIRVSQKFVRNTKMLELLNLTEIKELLDDLNKLKTFGASMNQLGRSVYCFCDDIDINNVLEILNTFKPKIQIFKLRINKEKILKTI